MKENKDLDKFLGKICKVHYDIGQPSTFTYTGKITFIGKRLLIIFDSKNQKDKDLLIHNIRDIEEVGK